MLICPKCQKKYNDDNLNFCLDDGSVLKQADNYANQEDAIPETVMINTPVPTAPDQSVSNPPPPSWGNQQQQVPPNWSATPSYQNAVAKPKSKSWIWVLGILGAVILLCGGGMVGLAVWFASLGDTNTNRKVVNTYNSNKTISGDDNVDKEASTNEDDAGFDKIDLSKWTDTNPTYATSSYKDGEFIMGTKEKGYYYVLVAGTLYQTEDATTRLTVRNVEEKPSRLGYGLVFHSNPKPLVQDYGFIIDADKQRYRVVKHSPGKETDVIKWTKSAVIKDGTQKNVLEVQDKDGEMTFYINGQKVDSAKNSDGYSGGIPGVYAGDGIPIAFSDFEISK